MLTFFSIFKFSNLLIEIEYPVDGLHVPFQELDGMSQYMIATDMTTHRADSDQHIEKVVTTNGVRFYNLSFILQICVCFFERPCCRTLKRCICFFRFQCVLEVRLETQILTTWKEVNLAFRYTRSYLKFFFVVTFSILCRNSMGLKTWSFLCAFENHLRKKNYQPGFRTDEF